MNLTKRLFSFYYSVVTIVCRVFHFYFSTTHSIFSLQETFSLSLSLSHSMQSTSLSAFNFSLSIDSHLSLSLSLSLSRSLYILLLHSLSLYFTNITAGKHTCEVKRNNFSLFLSIYLSLSLIAVSNSL